jgi:RecA/RadA recombinase
MELEKLSYYYNYQLIQLKMVEMFCIWILQVVFRPERILEIQKKSNINFNVLDKITVSRITNTSEQINSIKNFQEDNFSLIVIDNVTDLFSYEYKNNKSIFEKNSLFMKYMHKLSFYAIY